MRNGKRSGLLLVAVCVLASIACAASAQECGDVNGTNSVTSSDALAVLRKAVGQPVALVCPVPGILSRTGQSDCWNAAGTSIPCVGTGEDGDVRAGNALDYADNGDGTVSDNLSGLMWEKLARDSSIHDVGNDYTWTQALNTKTSSLNSDMFAGHEGWRVPNIRELESLATFGGNAPNTVALPFRTACAMGCTVLNCSCTAGDVYWSSTTDPADPTHAYGVNFANGFVGTLGKTEAVHVREVRYID